MLVASLCFFFWIIVSIMQPNIISNNSIVILVTVPSIVSMSPIFNLENRVPEARFPECRVTWWWLSKTAENKVMQQWVGRHWQQPNFSLMGDGNYLKIKLKDEAPVSNAFNIATITNSNVYWCRRVLHWNTHPICYVVVNVWYSLLQYIENGFGKL